MGDFLFSYGTVLYIVSGSCVFSQSYSTPQEKQAFLSANSLFHVPTRPPDRMTGSVLNLIEPGVLLKGMLGVEQVCFDFLKKYNFIPTFQCITNKFVRTRSTSFFFFAIKNSLEQKKNVTPSATVFFPEVFSPLWREIFTFFCFTFFCPCREREVGVQSSGTKVLGPKFFLAATSLFPPHPTPKWLGSMSHEKGALLRRTSEIFS